MNLVKKQCERDWWREKDYSDVLHEVSITAEKDRESIVRDIWNTVLNA